jgi:hypothetical protein
MKKNRWYRILRVKWLRHFHWLGIQWADIDDWSRENGYW